MKNKKNIIAIFIAIGVTIGIVYSILYALGYFDPTAKDLLEQSKCEFCPNGNYKQFFDSNYEKKWSAEKYIAKNEKEMIRVKTQNIEDSALFFFQLSDDHYVFYGMQRGDLLYKSKSKEVQAFFNKRCKNINATAVDRKLPDDYPFPVRLDSIMKNVNMILSENVNLTDSVGRAWKYVIDDHYGAGVDKVTPFYDRKPFTGYIYYGPKLNSTQDFRDYCYDYCSEDIECRIIGFVNGKKSGLSYFIEGDLEYKTKYTRNYKGRYSYDGKVYWNNSILLYEKGQLRKELIYEIIDFDFWEGCKYGFKYIWDLNFSNTSRQHVIKSSQYKNGSLHGTTVQNYEFGYPFTSEHKYERGYYGNYFKVWHWGGGRLKKNIKKIKNFNEIHVYKIGSYNRGEYSGEWVTYFFDGRVEKKVTYDGKGKESKHIEYDYEGRVKSNTGYKL
jgi:hypothetical protein